MQIHQQYREEIEKRIQETLSTYFHSFPKRKPFSIEEAGERVVKSLSPYLTEQIEVVNVSYQQGILSVIISIPTEGVTWEHEPE